jgi:hypothetical protein
MVDDQSTAGIGGQPADTGRTTGTIRGALMVVGNKGEAKQLARKLGMADLKWTKEGEIAQRAEFAEWPRSPELDRVIAVSGPRVGHSEYDTANAVAF